MKGNTNKVISEAKSMLKKQSYDAGHDLNHHENVWKIAQDIIKHTDVSVNTDLAHIACLWHDVLTKPYSQEELKQHERITQETADYLKKYTLENGFSDSEAQIAYLAVRHHEFLDKPVNIEGKILFDADKLDSLRIERALRFVEQDKAGKVPKWKINAYKKGVNLFAKQMRNRLHFAYSKKLFDEKIEKILDDNEIKNYAQKYNIDLDKIKRILNNEETFFDKLVSFFLR